MHEGEITEELKGDAITVSNIVTASFKEVKQKKQQRRKRKQS